MPNQKQYEDLTFTDDFLFCKVLSHNLELCRQLLEIILETKILKVELAETQKTVDITYDGKGIRLDVYVEDSDNTVYDLEMQTVDTRNLSKRSRYYQGMIDLNLIERGENYDALKESFVIFICTFDPFEENLCRYTFKNTCVEKNTLLLGDGCTKVFINPYGTKDNFTPNMQALLEYLCGIKTSNTFIQLLDNDVNAARLHKEWRVEYMTLEMRDRENIELGRIEERKQLFLSMQKNGLTAEKIADLCSIPVEQVRNALKKS